MATPEWGDSFDHYEKATTDLWSTSVMAKKWTTLAVGDASDWYVGPLAARPGAPRGNGARRMSANTDRHLLKTLPGGSLATRCISVWWYSSATLTSGTIITAFYDAGAEQVSVRLDASAHIIVSRAGTALGSASTNTVSVATWYHIQFKATIHDTAGVYEVRVNGSSTNWIPEATSADTKATANASANQIALGAGGGGVTTGWAYDDVLVADNFTGPVVAAFLRGSAPGNYQQWTPNSGSNRGAVAHTPTDDDGSFVASVTSGNIDTYVMEKLPAGGTPTIIGVQHIIYAKQDGGVQRTLRPKQRTSSTDYNGTGVNTGATYAYITEMAAVDPATTFAWTKTSLEAAELGYENV